MIHLSHNPDKLEQKALAYEQKGKTKKAIKYREKAQRLRAQHGGGNLGLANTVPVSTTTTTILPVQSALGGGGLGYAPAAGLVPRTPAMYEQNALKWEQRGNWTKAQKNREKVWRLRNPQYASQQAPMFYKNNSFIGYDLTPTATVTGTDLNRNGIPDQLEGGARVGGGLGMGGHSVLSHAAVGVPTATISGTDYNRDGIPDQLQGGVRVGGGIPVGGIHSGIPVGGIHSGIPVGGAPLLGGLGHGIQQPVGGYTDINRNGIPDQLEGGVRMGGAPLLGGLGHGIQQPMGGYTDYNRNGIPDQLEGGMRAPGGFLKKNRDPLALEAKAAEYERRGKPAKAQKLRQKAAQVRAGTYVSQRSPSMWEQNALKWEKRGNWDKAQKNRAKYWKHQNPQYASYAAPSFYQNNSFLGYNVPFTPSQSNLLGGYGHGIQQYPMGGMGGMGGGYMRPSRDVQRLEMRAREYEAKGKPQKALRLRNKIAQIQAGTYVSQRNPQIYEQHALKWEQRGNWEKAQKNRAKAWRLQNPQYAQHIGPQFYQNNRFLGYNVPFTPSQTTLLPYYRTQTTTTYNTTGGFPTQPFVGGMGGLQQQQYFLPSRDIARLEQRALEAERKGKPQKAQKLRAKILKINSGQHSFRSYQQIEQKAVFYEQQGNYKKAQKLREKAWRLQFPQYLSHPTAPSFYQNNTFLGYNIPIAGVGITSGIFSLHIGGGQTVYAAPIVEQVVRSTIVQETARPERIVEVQPIIHREVEAPTIKIIEQHVYETVPAAGPSTITNAAIVQETVIPKILEEVQPIVHRDVPAPFIERVEQHVTEHIVQPTITTKEVIQDSRVHIAAGAPVAAVGGVGVVTGVTTTQQTFVGGVQGVVGAGVPTATVTGTDYNRDGIPDQLQGGAVGGVGLGGVGLGGVSHVGLGGVGHVGLGGGVHVGGVPTATVTGTDYNRDGIPDQLQGGAHVGGGLGGRRIL